MNNSNPFDHAPIIYRYTRAQAIEDGVLIDLTAWAKETGFRIPVACTDSVWNSYIVPSDELRELGQSERGRAHDLLWMLRLAIRAHPADGEMRDRAQFRVIFQTSPRRHQTVTLKSICGPGDDAEPVLTITLIDED